MRFDDANQSYKAILADMNDALERLGEEWERVQYKKRRELPELKKNKFSTSAESYTSKWTGTVPSLAKIFMCKLEDVVTPQNLPFYDRYMDDCITKRKTNMNAPDTLLETLNSYHPRENPDHFLDTSFKQKMEISSQEQKSLSKTRKTTSTLEIGHSRMAETQNFSRSLTSRKTNNHQLLERRRLNRQTIIH